MRRVALVFLLTALMLIESACSGPSHMLMMNENAKLEIRTIKPKKGKAALVVMRTTSANFTMEFHTYLDKKMIGVTLGKSFFVKTDVEPGIHYLIVKSETFETGKIHFVQGRTYFIHYNPRTGWLGARISMYPQDPDTAVAKMYDGCSLFQYDPKNPGKDLSDEEYMQATREYEKNLTAGRHMEYATYRGFEIK